MEQTKDTRSNGIKVAIIALVLLLLLAVAGTLAYLTDSKSKTNNFSLATLDVTLVESKWDTTDVTTNGVSESSSNSIPDAAENVAPLGTVAKNPLVYNGTASFNETTGEVDTDASTPSTTNAYVRMKVEVPVASVTTVDSEGKAKASPENTILFNLGSVSDNVFTTGCDTTTYNWELKATDYYVDDTLANPNALVTTGVTKVVYTYLWKGGSSGDGKLSGGSSTSALFTDVQLVNLAKGVAADATAKDVMVTAQAIQTTSFATADAAWTAYDKQNAA